MYNPLESNQYTQAAVDAASLVLKMQLVMEVCPESEAAGI
jgi:hypothetical protein